MDEPTAFADACRRWCDLIEGAARLEPQVRVEALTAHLVHLYAAALRLEPADAPESPPPPAPWPTTWPGLGYAEDDPPPTSLLIEGVTSDVSRGLAWHAAGETRSAAAWWRSSFDTRWGTLAVAALQRLHHAAQAARTDSPATSPPVSAIPSPLEAVPTADEPAVAAPQPSPLLSFEPAPPQRRPTGRLRTRSEAPRGVLGFRFDVGPDGLRVTAVHPASPAASRLDVGDVIVSIDGMPLAGRTATEAGAALSGAPGQPRTFQVARGAGLVHVEVTAVAPEQLAAAPVTLRLLVLDRDAAQSVLVSLEELGLELRHDPDQEGLVELIADANAAAAARVVLGEGEVQGWWEVLDG
jgi:hypothetical protein